MSISTPFIERPIATSLLMAGLLLVGLVTYPLLPVAPLPQIDFPTISVNAAFPGASPETMASAVATPLETQFSQIAGVTQLTSTSVLGSTTITVQFDLNRNIDAASQDIQAAINNASGFLPKNLPTPPIYKKVNPADSPVLIFAVQSESLPLTVVDDYASNILAQQISQISGVAQVFIFGEQKPSVRVQVDPAKLANMGLALEDVRAVLGSVTVDQPKGNFDGLYQAFTLYDNDQLLSAEQYQDVILAYRNGSPVRIRDIGQAVDGPENLRANSLQNGKKGLGIAVFRQPGANVIDVVERVKGALPHLQLAVPPAVNLIVLTDRTKTIRASVDDVEVSLLITVALVVAVIFLFLRNFWATVIPSVTVPLSIIGTFAVMYVVGYSLDNLSLMALVISVGFVVDDAIVMIENIVRHLEEGLPPMEAALKGAGEIGFTIISISLSLVAVFIPLLLMGGIIGRLFHEFAVTVTVTILVSVVVSLTLTPMMCARFLQDERHAKHGRLYLMMESFFDGMRDFYAVGLRWVLRHQFFTLMVLFATIAATVWLYVIIPKGFFPQQDTGFIYGIGEASQDASYIQMSERAQAVSDLILADPDVESMADAVGSAGNPPNTARFFINLKPKPGRTNSADAIIRRLRGKLAALPGMNVFLQAAQDINVGGRFTRTQYQYTLEDADLNELNHWAPLLLDKMKDLPALRDVATDQQTNAATVSMTIDRSAASRFGILPQVIDDTLYDAFGQRQVNQYFTQLNQYHVILEVDPKLQTDPTALDKIYVKSPITNGMVPLASFLKFDTTTTNYLSINHQGQFPAVTLSFNLAPGAALGEAVEQIQRAGTEMHLPAAILGTFQGNAQAFQSSLASQPYLIAAALVVVYIILGVLYESYIHPITILSTIPSAGVGALVILMLFHYDLSVIALIGIILLIGIVKKNAIMMIDFALEAERHQGLAPEESIYQACLIRFRPIMMTTMAALLGGVPLMLGTGTGAEIRQPLGFAIVGGLILSQILTLYTTPVVYLYMDRLNSWLENRRGAPAAQAPSRVQKALAGE
jgi:HAE1 family hydrophobic/amphiphilic exporter-1/multidrug efflux pump